MKCLKQAYAFFISLTFLSAIVLFPSLAKTEERETISSLTLHVSAELGDDSDFSDMELMVTSDSDEYSIEEYEVINDTGSASYPVIQVVLEAEDGYYFDVSSRDIYLEGDEGDCISRTTRNNKETLILKIRLTDLTADMDSVSQAELNSDGEGSWDSVPGARKYEVRLYRGSSMVGSGKTTSNTWYDFSGMITRKGDYFFKVRAIGRKSGDKGDWTESDGYYFDEALSDYYYDGDNWSDYHYDYGRPSGPGSDSYRDEHGNGPGNSHNSSNSAIGWQQDHTGWWYRRTDGSYPANAWLFVDSNWFHFDNSGYMQTGWLNDEGRLFYLNPSSDGTKGRMVTGWQAINGKYYYFNPSSDGTKGALLTNTVIEGKYPVGADGALIQ
ncbi:hypothetical protein AALB16_01650 [Lachnospiraceae bacterium 62-35]